MRMNRRYENEVGGRQKLRCGRKNMSCVIWLPNILGSSEEKGFLLARAIIGFFGFVQFKNSISSSHDYQLLRFLRILDYILKVRQLYDYHLPWFWILIFPLLTITDCCDSGFCSSLSWRFQNTRILLVSLNARSFISFLSDYGLLGFFWDLNFNSKFKRIRGSDTHDLIASFLIEVNTELMPVLYFSYFLSYSCIYVVNI